MVAAGKANVSTFVTPARANYVRFQTFAADASASAHDLDMFVLPGGAWLGTYALSRRAAGRTRTRSSTATYRGLHAR